MSSEALDNNTVEKQVTNVSNIGVEKGDVDMAVGTTGVAKDLSPWSMIAVAFNICNSWAAVSYSLQIALEQGGPAALLYGMITSAFAYMSVALSFGELASVYPTIGGQYHITSILSPPKYNRGLSYTDGLLTVFSWLTLGASACMVPAYQVIAVASYYHPDFVVQDWHYFMIYVAVATFMTLYNLFAIKKLPKTYDAAFVLSMVLFLTSFVVFLARSSPKASNKFVWGEFINVTGWSDGVCFLSSLLTSCFIFVGLDASMHLAEETQNPRRDVPRAAVAAISIGFVTAFLFTIALLYSISDFEAIIAIDGYLPFEITRQGMRSDLAAVIFIIMYMVLGLIAATAILQTASRTTWSLAIDNAIFFSSTFEKVDTTLGVPVWALLLNYGIIIICGLVFLASSTAFNALVGSCVVLQQLSFCVPIALIVWRKRSNEYLPRNRKFYLPSWLGWTANIIVLVFTSVITIFFMLPVFLPVTATNMNYTCVIVVIAGILGVVNWYGYARKHYQGPRIELQG